MKDIFDYLENAMDNEINELADKAPELSDANIEKLLTMSERKYNDKKELSDESYEAEVHGVDRYDRPLWHKYLFTAAACLVVVIGITGIALHMKRAPIDDGPVNVKPEILATVTALSSTDTGTLPATTGTMYSDTKSTVTTVTAASETTSQSTVVTTTATTAIAQTKTTSAVTTTASAAEETIAETGVSVNTAGVYSSKSGVITLYADGTGTISFQDTVSIRWNDRELIGEDFTYPYTISGDTITIDQDGMERSFTKGGEMPYKENQTEYAKVYFVPDYSDGLASSTEYDQQIADEALKVVDDLQTIVGLFDYIDTDKLDMTDTFTITALENDQMNDTLYDRTSTYARYVDPKFDSIQSIRDFIHSCVADSNNYYEYNFSGSTYNGYDVPLISPGCKVDTVAPPRFCDYDGRLYINIDYIDNLRSFMPVLADNHPLIVKYYPSVEEFKVMIPLKSKDSITLFNDPNGPEMYVLEFLMVKQPDGLYKRESIYDGALNEYENIISALN